MKFHDLDFDCLEYVLEYLDLHDLLNVADSNKRLRKAAELVYTGKYGDRRVVFGIIKLLSDQTFVFKNSTYSREIESKGFKTSMQLLRCFGPLISTIRLVKIRSSETNQPLMDKWVFTYINDYCADYLKKLYVANQCHKLFYQRLVLHYFNRPFKNLVLLSQCDYTFSENISLNTLFPNLQDLASGHIHNTSFFKFQHSAFSQFEIIVY